MKQINIPLSCPSCEGKMYSVRYDAPLKILKERSWQICRRCGFERNTDDFKRGLLTV
jgi:C4-type Zn-finger protein